MRIQAIDNNICFQKLVIKNPQQMPKEIYQGIVENEGIRNLAQRMDNKGIDLIAEYVKVNYGRKNALTPEILLYNAKQFFNKYFKYNEEPYKNEYTSIYPIYNRRWSSDEELLEELHYFDPYDIRIAVHSDVRRYFNKIKEERATKELGNNLQESVEPKKQSLWKRLFK